MTRIIKAPRLVEESRVIGQAIIRQPEPEASETPVELQAEMLLVEARREAESIRQQAYEEGYRQGAEAARVDLQTQWDQAFQDMLREVEGVFRQRDALVLQAEEDVVRLALLVAAKVLKQEVREPDYLRGIIQASLEKLVGRSRIRIFLNAVDFERFQNGQIPFPIEAPVTPVLDPSLGAGGCRIETECGRADASLPSQLEAILQALLPEPGIAEAAVAELHEPPEV
ncbi:MAG: FliH/SctL family protein [Bacteroidota bacterium]